jgi:hypothetical protein
VSWVGNKECIAAVAIGLYEHSLRGILQCEDIERAKNEMVVIHGRVSWELARAYLRLGFAIEPGLYCIVFLLFDANFQFDCARRQTDCSN